MLKITGQMTPQGADRAKQTLTQGGKFFLKAVGIGAAFALIFWSLPHLADFILKIKHG